METLLGKTISQFRIDSPLGSGGMGVVYRARDLELDRDVAIKVLPTELARDSARLALFRQEAKAIASLNHPNINAIYRFVGPKRGTRFLVLELVEGETLAARLQSGRLPFKEALGIVAQLADALAAAHGRGVVHCDLKPANVMITASGVVKVLDFGLAKRLRKAAADPAATVTTELATGMGTAGYASPEQIRGEDPDERADVFAFGSVLFECLSGGRAFGGERVQDVLAQTLTHAPDWSALPRETPERLRALLARCLEKDSKKRLPRAEEARTEIEAMLRGESSAPVRAEGRHNLPVRLSTFIGRGTEIAECLSLLDQARLLTLTGPGGSGKTRLAIRLGSDLTEAYPDGVWFIDLAPLSVGTRVPEVVAATMGIREEAGTPLLDTVARAMEDQRALLIMDNCEHLLEDVGAVAERLLHAAPGVRMLATSREAIGIEGETTYAVRSMQVPPVESARDLERVGESEAVRLFVDRARQMAREFSLSQATAPAIVEICRRLDGIPLAIELAAARIKVLTVDQIRSKLDDRFRLLAVEGRAMPRQRTLLATMQWSYDLLTTDEQRLLRFLAVFAGGWTLEAATYVAGEEWDEFEVLDLITRLIDKSLVSMAMGDGEARYSMLETVREYTLGRLKEAGDEEAARTRHRAFYMALAEETGRNVLGAKQRESFARLDRELENLLLAHAWPSSEGDRRELPLFAMRKYCMNRGLLELGLRITREVLQRDDVPQSIRAHAFIAMGDILYFMGRYEEARQAGGDCIGIAKQLGDKEAATDALRLLANLCHSDADFPKALAYFEESIQLAREIGDHNRISSGLNSLAELHRAHGGAQAAIPLYEEALVSLRQLQGRENIAVVGLNLAMASIACGDVDRARENLLAALAIVEETGSKLVVHLLLDAAAGLAASLDEAARAARIYGASQAHREETHIVREPADERFLMPLLDRARAGLGRNEYEAATAEGGALSLDQILNEIKRWLKNDAPAAPTDTTALLIARVGEGDERARDQLARRFMPMLKRWAHGRLPAQARGMIDTDDLVQMTMVRALGRLDAFEVRREGAFVAFLRKILLNQIRDAAVVAARRPGQDDSAGVLVDLGPSPLDEFLGRNTFERYEAALSRLPEAQREAIILRAEMGYAFEQIALATGAPSANAARMSVKRGIQKVAKALGVEHPNIDRDF